MNYTQEMLGNNNNSEIATRLAGKLKHMFPKSNTTIYIYPSQYEYYTHMNAFLALAIFVSSLLTIINIFIYFATLTRLRNRLEKPLLKPTICMVSFYPLISLCALITISWPRSWLICHTIMHLSFPIGAVIFRELLFHYAGSELNFLKEIEGSSAQINTPPCCCCCVCLPKIIPTHTKLMLLRYMIWQLPFIQGGIMLVINAFYFGDPAIYASVWSYFLPFIICSIILGIWALNITVRMIAQVRPNYGLIKKMFSLQLIIMLCKLQYIILDTQLNRIPLGGEYPIDHTIYKRTIINILLLVEMLLVSMLAQSAYQIPAQVPMEHSEKYLEEYST